MPSSPSPVIINNQGDNTTTVSNTSMDLTTILSIVFGVVSICAISFILYLYYQRNIHDKQKQSNPKSKGLENTKSINHSIAISKVSGNEINSNGKGLQKNEHKKDTFISNDNQKNEYRRKGKDEVLVIEHTDASQGEKSSKENQAYLAIKRGSQVETPELSRDRLISSNRKINSISPSMNSSLNSHASPNTPPTRPESRASSRGPSRNTSHADLKQMSKSRPESRASSKGPSRNASHGDIKQLSNTVDVGMLDKLFNDPKIQETIANVRKQLPEGHSNNEPQIIHPFDHIRNSHSGNRLSESPGPHSQKLVSNDIHGTSNKFGSRPDGPPTYEPRSQKFGSSDNQGPRPQALNVNRPINGSNEVQGSRSQKLTNRLSDYQQNNVPIFHTSQPNNINYNVANRNIRADPTLMNPNVGYNLNPNITQQGPPSLEIMGTDVFKTVVDTGTQVMALPGYLSISDSNAYTLDKKVGKGGGGEIFLTVIHDPEILLRAKGKAVVAKFVKDLDHELFVQEVSIMALFDKSPNFAELIGYQDEKKAIFMTYYPMKSMHHYIQKNKVRKLKHIIWLVLGIAKALSEMHNSGIVHNDIKPANVLIDQDYDGSLMAKVTDFGLANIVEEKVMKVKYITRKNIRGMSIHYVCPYRLRQQYPLVSAQIAKTADIYSLAIVILETMIAKLPWSNNVVQNEQK